MRCPCGSGLDYDDCCGIYLRGEAHAPTAEALMRSRYTAYTRAEIDYIVKTLAPEKHGAFDRVAATEWAMQADWLGLEIGFTDRGGPGDREGVVAFVATYKQGGQTIALQEASQFRRGDDGAWLYVSGDVNARPVDGARRSAAKVGRNDPCPCGSGRKYKMCCGRAV